MQFLIFMDLSWSTAHASSTYTDVLYSALESERRLNYYGSNICRVGDKQDLFNVPGTGSTYVLIVLILIPYKRP